MLFGKASGTIKDKQAIFFMTIGNNAAIRIIDFNSKSSILKKEVNMVLAIYQVEDW